MSTDPIEAWQAAETLGHLSMDHVIAGRALVAALEAARADIMALLKRHDRQMARERAELAKRAEYMRELAEVVGPMTPDERLADIRSRFVMDEAHDITDDDIAWLIGSAAEHADTRRDLELIKAKLGIDRCGAQTFYSGGVAGTCHLPAGHDGDHRGPGIGNVETMWSW